MSVRNWFIERGTSARSCDSLYNVGGLNDALVELMRIRGNAEVFPDFCVRNQHVFDDFGYPGLGVNLWIDDRQFRLEDSIARAFPMLHDTHFVTVRPAIKASPLRARFGYEASRLGAP